MFNSVGLSIPDNKVDKTILQKAQNSSDSQVQTAFSSYTNADKAYSHLFSSVNNGGSSSSSSNGNTLNTSFSRKSDITGTSGSTTGSTGLDKNIFNMDNSIKEIESKTSAANNSITTATTDISRFNTTLTNLDAKDQNSKKTLSDKKSSLSSKQSKYQTSVSQNQQLNMNARLDELQIATLNNQIKDINQEIAEKIKAQELDGQISSIGGQITQCNDQIATINASANPDTAKVQQLQKQITQLQQQQQEAINKRGQCKVSNTDINDLYNQKDQLERKVIKYQDDLNDSTTKINKNNSTISSYKSEKAFVDALEESTNAQSSQISQQRQVIDGKKTTKVDHIQKYQNDIQKMITSRSLLKVKKQSDLSNANTVKSQIVSTATNESQNKQQQLNTLVQLKNSNSKSDKTHKNLKTAATARSSAYSKLQTVVSRSHQN